METLHVITGRGTHSAGGIARVKPAVCKQLEEQRKVKGWSFAWYVEENQGGSLYINLVKGRKSEEYVTPERGGHHQNRQ